MVSARVGAARGGRKNRAAAATKRLAMPCTRQWGRPRPGGLLAHPRRTQVVVAAFQVGRPAGGIGGQPVGDLQAAEAGPGRTPRRPLMVAGEQRAFVLLGQPPVERDPGMPRRIELVAEGDAAVRVGRRLGAAPHPEAGPAGTVFVQAEPAKRPAKRIVEVSSASQRSAARSSGNWPCRSRAPDAGAARNPELPTLSFTNRQSKFKRRPGRAAAAGPR